MAGRLLARGMIAGVLAACLAFVFARVFGEPQVDLAIAFEAARNAAAGMAPEPEIVSRSMQASFGLLTAAVMYGAAYGGVFAIVFALAYGRVGRLSARALALLLAGAGFLTFVLIPDLKYPPNPPSVGLPATIGLRTATYFEMIVLSVCVMAVSVLAGQRLVQQLGRWNGIVCAAGLFVVLTALVQCGLPDISEVPEDFPAVVLWRFREAAIGMQIVLWGALGLIFGPLAETALASSGSRRHRLG
ncbi:CbtA family protein [Acetobacter sp. TBRC 12305]|uniref:CbtA family protein n=1 Tax=Acetobacter garciniae TaxID=2817435 RepID=A0A939KQP4_9PROT|nr:CbtA family protein [Acetobacter garciniae]MBO1325704.1 CbtA family protein [Acetobacter garciniae]MBX0345604.1 CbtA family protein [Acetobacter garciniae]